jgi:hypothetical protein
VTRRRAAGWAAAGVLVAAAVAGIGPGRNPGPPLDPRSTGPLGLAALVEVLDRLDVDVRVGGALPREDEPVALVVQDRFDEAAESALAEWVEDGGRLVVADPGLDAAADVVGVTAAAFTEPSIEPRCEDPAARGVGRVAVSGGLVLEAAGDARGCFPRNGGFWMVRDPRGDGEVVTLGGPQTLTNALLGEEDGAVLAVALLTPPDGGGVRVLTGGAAPGAGLSELLPDGVRLALVQVAVVWLGAVWWRGRRHGRPVEEVGPVRIDAAETTVALGALLHRAGRAQDAAALVRADLRRRLVERLGTPEAAGTAALAAAAADRTDLPAGLVHRLLDGPLPADDAGLVAFTSTAAHVALQLRQRTAADPTAGSTAAPPPRQPERSPTS